MSSKPWDSVEYFEKVKLRLKEVISETHLEPLGFRKKIGKVRDVYEPIETSDYLVIATTDRISAFDRNLASIPYKGEVLNQISVFWFEQTQHIIKNHFLEAPDPSLMVVKKCSVFPIEFVVRGYITGATSTSMWTIYSQGERKYCGLDLPDGLVQNQLLDHPVVTPTTKEKDHDRLISPDEIVAEHWMQRDDYEKCAAAALALFAVGQDIAKQHGLILVDTKYEFGKDADGSIVLVDEIHTPDSSRYWISATYEKRFNSGKSPESIDKDILRRWYLERCDPYKDAVLPEAPEDLVQLVSLRYIQLYERITGLPFNLDSEAPVSTSRIQTNLEKWLQKRK